jgi:hypothetical protein
MSEKASDAADAVRQAPEMARERVEGNPLAAGLIAYGFGMLVSSLLPPTRAEQELAHQAQPLVRSAMDEAKSVGQEVVADLREPAREAVEQVKSAATDTAQSVSTHATEAARETASSSPGSTPGHGTPTAF